jgi:hypothetical protein
MKKKNLPLLSVSFSLGSFYRYISVHPHHNSVSWAVLTASW